MYMFRMPNVNQMLHVALRSLVDHPEHTRRSSARGTNTTEFDQAVASVYIRPWQNVLYHPIRDCNHFFHFMEAIWMLAGRDDVEFLNIWTSQMEQFSDDGTTLHGAYGYRWTWENQLANAVEQLRDDPDSRRAAITLLMPYDSHYRGKDKPCNVSVLFKNRDGKLDMTVCNRSNDVILGAYGANAVHFSVLQQFVAGVLGLRTGMYNQISDSLHFYHETEMFRRLYMAMFHHPMTFADVFEAQGTWHRTEPLFHDMFESDVTAVQGMLSDFCDRVIHSFNAGTEIRAVDSVMGKAIPELDRNVLPAVRAFFHYKDGNVTLCHDHLQTMTHSPWATAMSAWVNNRTEFKQAFQETKEKLLQEWEAHQGTRKEMN